MNRGSDPNPRRGAWKWSLKKGNKYSDSFLRGTGKVENRVAISIFIGLGMRVLDLVTWVGAVLQILGAAPATGVAAASRVERVLRAPPQLRGVLGRSPSASAERGA